MSNPNDTQPAHLARVGAKIGDAVLEFVRRVNLTYDQQFTAGDLRAFVATVHPTAPASADRILRDLRAKGVVGYVVVNRRQSLYRVTNVSELS